MEYHKKIKFELISLKSLFICVSQDIFWYLYKIIFSPKRMEYFLVHIDFIDTYKKKMIYITSYER